MLRPIETKYRQWRVSEQALFLQLMYPHYFLKVGGMKIYMDIPAPITAHKHLQVITAKQGHLFENDQILCNCPDPATGGINYLQCCGYNQKLKMVHSCRCVHSCTASRGRGTCI